MKLPILFMLLFGSITLTAQSLDFLPAPPPNLLDRETELYYESRLKSLQKNLPLQGPGKRAMKRLYEARYEKLFRELRGGYMIDRKGISDLCQLVFERIIQANPDLQKLPLRLYVSEETGPNAVSLGEGTVILYLGLLRRLENQHQLAFVISHEIAHFVLDHSRNTMVEQITYAYNRAAREAEAARIENSSRAYEEVVNLLQKRLYQRHRYSRQAEFEADSLGLRFVMATSYAPEGALGLLEILDQVDADKFQDSIAYRQRFDQAAYPFQDRWMKPPAKSGFIYGKNDFALEMAEDSVGTHPDCQLRIQVLQRQLAANQSSLQLARGRQRDALFRLLHPQMDKEWLTSFYRNGQVGKSLYYSLKALTFYQDDPYVHSMVGLSLYHLYQSKKNHRLGKVLDFPQPKQPEDYQTFLTFVRNLKLKELLGLCQAYMGAQPEAWNSYEPILFAKVCAASLSPESARFQELSKTYQKTFPQGVYLEEWKALAQP
ncbi:MAG: M48 family metalloprotease [Bacteroidota bacterium]